MTLYSPPEAAQIVDIAEPTLRAWVAKHGDLLSEYAKRSKRRQYTERDIIVLQRIKGLVDDGVGHSDVAMKVAALGLPDEADDDIAQEAPRARPSAGADAGALQIVSMQLVAAQNDQSQRLTGQDARIADQAEQIADLRERLARVEAEAEALRRDVAAQGRLLEALGQRLDGHEGIMGSVGDKVHWHEGIGRTLSNMKS